MTYCLGILLSAGVVLASDSRSNAGVDQVTEVEKLALFTKPGERVIGILSAGNLATSQSVATQLRQGAGSADKTQDILATRTMFDAAGVIGQRLREVIEENLKYVKPYGDSTASFIVGGQIAGEPPRLFEVYAAGNFVEASPRSCYLQIGETKYGKPILDRALRPDSSLDDAAKLALLSFDATIRSNISVAPPIDLLRYTAGSYDVDDLTAIDEQDPYWADLRRAYSEGLVKLVEGLPTPPTATGRATGST